MSFLTRTPALPSPFTIQGALICAVILLVILSFVYGAWKAMCYILNFIDERSVERGISFMEQVEKTRPQSCSLSLPEPVTIRRNSQLFQPIHRTIPLPLHAVPGLVNYAPCPVYITPTPINIDSRVLSSPSPIWLPARPPPIATHYHSTPRHPSLLPLCPLPKPTIPLPPTPKPSKLAAAALLVRAPLKEVYADQQLQSAEEGRIWRKDSTVKETSHNHEHIYAPKRTAKSTRPSRTRADKENAPVAPLKSRRIRA
ncbi:hypothetical protein ONZ45_g4851 [Pleurotus djamor]|nr:hypothetical protein ONZ45_g4851 [Pleurotus djamor]